MARNGRREESVPRSCAGYDELVAGGRLARRHLMLCEEAGDEDAVALRLLMEGLKKSDRAAGRFWPPRRRYEGPTMDGRGELE